MVHHLRKLDAALHILIGALRPVTFGEGCRLARWFRFKSRKDLCHRARKYLLEVILVAAFQMLVVALPSGSELKIRIKKENILGTVFDSVARALNCGRHV